MREDFFIIIFPIAVLFRHGLSAPLREAETMTIAIAGDDELISFEKDIKHGTPKAEDLSHRHSERLTQPLLPRQMSFFTRPAGVRSPAY